MLQERIALRYAKALYEDASAKGKLEEVLADQQGMLDLLDQSRELRSFLQSPILSNSRKQRIIRAIFQGRVAPLTEEFYEFLTSRGREEMIPFIARAYVERYHEAHNVVIVEVVTASPLSEAQAATLKAKLEQQTGKTIKMKQAVRPHVIGGLSVRVGDLQLDNTFSGALLRARQRIETTHTLQQ